MPTPPEPEHEIYKCHFDNKKTFEDLTPDDKLDYWQYEEMTCYAEQSELITDGTSTFYLTKNISYGDFFLIFFLTAFALFFIFDFIFRFIYKIKVNFRH